MPSQRSPTLNRNTSGNVVNMAFETVVRPVALVRPVAAGPMSVHPAGESAAVLCCPGGSALGRPFEGCVARTSCRAWLGLAGRATSASRPAAGPMPRPYRALTLFPLFWSRDDSPCASRCVRGLRGVCPRGDTVGSPSVFPFGKIGDNCNGRSLVCVCCSHLTF